MGSKEAGNSMVRTHTCIYPSHHQCLTLAGDLGPVTGGGVSKMGKLQHR